MDQPVDINDILHALGLVVQSRTCLPVSPAHPLALQAARDTSCVVMPFSNRSCSDIKVNVAAFLSALIPTQLRSLVTTRAL